MKRFLVLLCLTTLCVVAQAQKTKVSAERQLIEQGKKNVIDMLKDPDSVKFKNVFIAQQTNVCGELNAKNGYGGYTGFRKFYSVNKDYSRIDSGGDFDTSWQIFCTNSNANVQSMKADPLPSIELEK